MQADGDDWPIRSIGRDRIVEHFLVRHFGYAFQGTAAEDARPEVGAALDRWVDLGLAHATSAEGERLFDPAETCNFMVAAGMRGDDRFWEDHFIRTERGLLRVQQGMAADAPQVPNPANLPPRQFRIELKRTYDASAVQPGARARLRLPLPIADQALRDLRIDYDAPDGATVEIKPAMLDAGIVVADPGPIALRIEASFEARANPGEVATLDDAARATFTAPREGLICINDPLAGMARETAAGLPDDWSRATALFHMIGDRFRMGAIPYHALDPADPLQWSLRTRWIDCQIASAMLCALCRSLGIPARIASGYQLYAATNLYHYWAEIWTRDRGWVSLDSMDWHLSRGGKDPEWRDILAGAMDYRLKVQVLPHLFTGPSTVRLPRCWHMLARRLPQGMETSFVDAASGRPVYRDRLAILEP